MHSPIAAAISKDFKDFKVDIMAPPTLPPPTLSVEAHSPSSRPAVPLPQIIRSTKNSPSLIWRTLRLSNLRLDPSLLLSLALLLRRLSPPLLREPSSLLPPRRRRRSLLDQPSLLSATRTRLLGVALRDGRLLVELGGAAHAEA
ncbi:hypothetical protein FA09DRAFT_95740 [Tilletiopsis washingtonensis]|uniref:Uncharacterized protein n=1 Tax=Tilletiopsis washingtonensis TaxID=58919 RepID=A0A316Z5H2_9BASI|nr:hypothetical protein FA09DRAFT_95740 [Tilletiopsis washingtonensis]PWN96218.1 hypothetical protein FA09DRAFT_95740 [Tilletiopsis washingtonensis]